MISVVCVYNNVAVLNNWLMKSLKTQTVKHELILVDNTYGQFKSASKALNYGGSKARGKYIMFVHQDVNLCSDAWLEDVEKIIATIPNIGVAGVAGARRKGNSKQLEILSNILHGIPPVGAGSVKIQIPERVQTVDECCIIVPSSVFQVLKFDEKVCDNWHLYAVDYCLGVQRLGYEVYVIPACLHHKSTGIYTKDYIQFVLSGGGVPEVYYRTLKKLLKKHRATVKWVCTTKWGYWNTTYPLIFQRAVRLVQFFAWKLHIRTTWSRALISLCASALM